MGKNCRIGDGVKITRSHLWDDVVVEKGAVVCDSIVCHGVVRVLRHFPGFVPSYLFRSLKRAQWFQEVVFSPWG